MAAASSTRSPATSVSSAASRNASPWAWPWIVSDFAHSHANNHRTCKNTHESVHTVGLHDGHYFKHEWPQVSLSLIISSCLVSLSCPKLIEFVINRKIIQNRSVWTSTSDIWTPLYWITNAALLFKYTNACWQRRYINPMQTEVLSLGFLFIYVYTPHICTAHVQTTFLLPLSLPLSLYSIMFYGCLLFLLWSLPDALTHSVTAILHCKIITFVFQ